jgi:hypothetical protein
VEVPALELREGLEEDGHEGRNIPSRLFGSANRFTIVRIAEADIYINLIRDMDMDMR